MTQHEFDPAGMDSVQALKEQLENHTLFLSCHRSVATSVYLLDDGDHGARVVGFRKQEAPTPKSKSKGNEDDLTRLRGIGLDRAGRLREAGVNTFQDLATASVQRLREIFPEPVITDDMFASWQQAAQTVAGERQSVTSS